MLADVFGTDPDLLAMVPQPVLAVVLLFPITAVSKAGEEQMISKVQSQGQTVSPDVWFCKQTIGNACGTVGILHAVANSPPLLAYDGWIKSFLEKCQPLHADDRAELLTKDEELDKCHQAAASEGQTATPSIDEKISLHFVTFICKDNCLYEMDGRKPFPLNLGPATPDTLLNDACANIKTRYIDADPNEVNFNIMALGPRLQ